MKRVMRDEDEKEEFSVRNRSLYLPLWETGVSYVLTNIRSVGGSLIRL